MAFPILPLAIGAVALVAILATKKSNGGGGMSAEAFRSTVMDKTELRCGERMTYIDAKIFDQGMFYLKVDDVKKLIQVYENRGQKNLADCLRAQHGL